MIACIYLLVSVATTSTSIMHHCGFLGHSVICHFQSRLLSGDIPSHLTVNHVASVEFVGKGGLKASSLARGEGVLDQLMGKFRRHPSVIVVLVGGNDFRDGVSVEQTVTDLDKVASTLKSRYGVQHVVVCYLLPRHSAEKMSTWWHMTPEEAENYRQWACAVNARMNTILPCPSVSVWNHQRHMRFQPQFRDYFASDGVHLSNKGNYHLYRSFKGAVLLGTMRARFS